MLNCKMLNCKMLISMKSCHPWVSLFLIVFWMGAGLPFIHNHLTVLIPSAYILFMLYQLIAIWTCVVLYFHMKEMKSIRMSGDITPQVIILFTEFLLLIINLALISFFLNAKDEMVFDDSDTTLHNDEELRRVDKIVVFLSGQMLNHGYWFGLIISKY